MSDNEKRLPLSGHLEELRSRLVKSLVALGIGTSVAFIFFRPLFRILLRPLGQHEPIYTEPTEMIGTIMRVSLYTGAALAMPYLVYQFLMFVIPALKAHEKRYVYIILPGVFVSFLAGVAFAYFVALPPALRFLTSFGAGIARPEIKIASYVALFTTLLFWMGVAFETPLIIFFLARIRVVRPQTLARRRRYAIVGAFLLGAVITPTFDPVNQTIVALPVIVLFELGVLLAKLAWRGA